ncbi:MAG: methylated-DNA--[protein]-cysteine S-methyltransferase [Pseudomonadales bacterium]|nr:methylated-DNA--[protein]-cysteine S-methyltransferase [Pseudomonadales bacterium]
MIYRSIKSPIGDLLLAGDDSGLRIIGFPGGKGYVEPEANWIFVEDCFVEVEIQLNEYFSGTRKTFELSLTPSGTAFQLEVLSALQEIPCGETRCYSDIAKRIGRPKAVRAVGAANGRNPLPIIIPCHRVIGSDGSLTGFGGGLDAKKFLLNLEGASFLDDKQESLF